MARGEAATWRRRAAEPAAGALLRELDRRREPEATIFTFCSVERSAVGGRAREAPNMKKRTAAVLCVCSESSGIAPRPIAGQIDGREAAGAGIWRSLYIHVGQNLSRAFAPSWHLVVAWIYYSGIRDPLAPGWRGSS